MNIKIWLMETRPQFLLLVPVCTFTGLIAAIYQSYTLNLVHFMLAFFGALMAHISVNVLNDYFDYKSGIDLKTIRTPFSGGSGIIPAGLLKPKNVFFFGIICLLIVALIGIYFIFIYKLWILPLVILGIILIFTYTPYITKLYGITELLGPGLGFGLIVFGTYFTQSGVYDLLGIIVSIMSGLLIANLLLLNEFPDVDADITAGRKHLPIVLGRKKAAKIYCLINIFVYILIIGGILSNVLPLLAIFSLLTIPLAIKTMKGVLNNYNTINSLIPFIGMNVLVVLLTPILLSSGILISIFI